MRIETRLLDYIDETAPPITPDEAIARRQSPNRSWERIQTPRPGRGLAWALAAFVGVIAVAGLYVAFSRDDSQIVDHTSLPIPTTVPTIVPKPTLLDGDVLVGQLEPGAYFAQADEDPSTTAGATFIVEEPGWMGQAAGLLRHNFGVLLHIHQVPEPIVSPACNFSPPMVDEATAADLADAFADSGFTVLEAPQAVHAFGLDGHHVVIEVPEGCHNGSYLAGNGSMKFVHPGDVLQAWLFDLDGHIVMVEALLQHGEGPTEEDLAALETAIDSLVLTP